MAFTRWRNTRSYEALAADPLPFVDPQDAAAIPDGSKVYLTDTKAWKVLSAGAWDDYVLAISGGGTPTQITQAGGSVAITPAGAVTIAPLAGQSVGLAVAPPASANTGLLNIGESGFAGGGGTNFAGLATGTYVALNIPSAFSGLWLDVQYDGSPAIRADNGSIYGGPFGGGLFLISDYTAGLAALSLNVDGSCNLVGTTGAGIAVSNTGAVTIHSTGIGVTISNGNHLAFSGIAPQNIIAGVTSLSLRNNANSADNLIILDAGTATFRNTVNATTFVGALTGNASTATALATARAINGVNFDGTAAITVTADASTLTGTTLKSTVLASSLTSLGTLTALTMGGTLTLGANTLALASATVSGTPTWASSQALTLSTAAQPNITSVGTLTGLTLSGAVSNTAAGAASTPALTLSGAPFAGTTTTSFPLLYVNDIANATPSNALNANGTYLGVNGHGTADLLNLMVDGASRFSVAFSGKVLVNDPNGSTTVPMLGIGESVSGFALATPGVLELILSSTDYFRFLSAGLGRLSLASTGQFAWSSTGAASGTVDIAAGRNAAGVMEINSGTAGTFRDLIARNVLVPTGIATNATDGFAFVPAGAGAPTGVPSGAAASRVALYFDTTDSRLYWYANSEWHYAAQTA